MKSSRPAAVALATMFMAASCGLSSPCAKEFVIYEADGQWYTERVDDGTIIFGPGSNEEATAACIRLTTTNP
jgi:hypothetical protein